MSALLRLHELRGGRFSRRAVLKSVGYGVGGTAVVGGAAFTTLVPGMPIWRLLNDQSLRTLTGHTNTIHAVAITRDGKTAVSGSEDKTLKVWDISR